MLEPGSMNHVALPTLDSEKCARFYCNVLGFRIVPRPAFSFDGHWLYREEVGVMLHLTHNPNHKVNTGPMETRGSHFAMRYADIEHARERLKAAGIETVERVLPDYGYQQIFFRDPDGNIIEIGEWPEVCDMDTTSLESQ